MNLKTLSIENLEDVFLRGNIFLDVRAPVEFALGSLPGAKNMAILSDDERAQIGTDYKINGNASATRLGHQLVSGEIKEKRIADWIAFIQKNPTSLLYCFRGGQRSKITQQWLSDKGVEITRLETGYKGARQFLIDKTSKIIDEHSILSLAGPTGSGKTTLISELKGSCSAIDLEGLARHRGSAFGSMNVPQPSQIDFENNLAVELLRLQTSSSSKLVFEDESRLIGKCILPNALFLKLNSAPAVLIDERLERRVQKIFSDYILDSAIGQKNQVEGLKVFEKYKNSLLAISKKLGGLRTKEVLELMHASEQRFLADNSIEENRLWIERLLVYYYDPMYLSSLERRDIQFVFKGSHAECFEYLKSLN